MTAKKAAGTTQKIALVLRALAEKSPNGHRLADICEATGIAKTNVHRLLTNLSDIGFVEKDAKLRRYRLGNELAALGLAAYSTNLVDAAKPALLSLAKKTGDTVYLVIRSGCESVCLDREEGDFPVKVLVVNKGERMPLGIGAGGLAILSALEDSEIDHTLNVVGDTLEDYENCSVEIMRELIGKTRSLGYAFNDGMVISSMSAVGVPIFDSNGTVRAAIAVAAIKERMETPRRLEIVNQLNEEISRLSEIFITKADKNTSRK